MISLLAFAFLLLPFSTQFLLVDTGSWYAPLDGAQVVPPNGAQGTASVTLIYGPNQYGDPQRCDYMIAYTHLSGAATGALIRWGRQGENGPLASTLVSGTFDSPRGGSVDIPWSVLGHLPNLDTLYVVITTDAYPDGEVRGRFQELSDPAVERKSWGSIRGSYR